MKSRLLSILIILFLLIFQSVLILPNVCANLSTDITVAQAYAMIYSNSYPNLVIMDVRDAAARHIIPGAILVPITSIGEGILDFSMLDEWIIGPGQGHKNDVVIVYAGSDTRSNIGANYLIANGFTKVYHLLGGYYAWIWGLITDIPIDVKPDILNLGSNGKWVTCYIELPTTYSVNEIVVSTITMNNIIPAAIGSTEIGDYNSNGVPDLKVKFDRAMVQNLLSDKEIRLVTTFTLSNQMMCGGWDTVKLTG